MPPLSTANLRAFCSQRLELKDESYCYRLPMTYVPAYMGNVAKAQDGEDEPIDGEEAEIIRQENLQMVHDVEDMPIKMRASGLWDIQV